MIEKGKGWDDRGGPAAGCGFCAICLEKIAMQDMALVNGCEHAYWFVCNVSKAARPLLNHQLSRQLSDNDAGSGSSRGPKKKEASKDVTGRRAKRALK
ncbi:hypothetical protein B296_00029451 [Ensete ventricosum]|uniref:Uncharacterized protein n=1 Tax=Ensete ventricosum TaxID=4639 RepID=A0A426YCD3_ENSVE|nr:hypothetical protein B296_00029451 [Ensete ventricosum]